ncbi:MAG: four helix bundle protein [Anaerolineae bacterium]
MRDFRRLEVWRRAHELTLDVYRVTEHFPKAEMYGLTSQLRRACASIPANIAEGCGRGGDSEKARFIRIAMGSASEAGYHLLLAHDLGFMDAATYQDLVNRLYDVKRMLVSFHQTLLEDKG